MCDALRCDPKPHAVTRAGVTYVSNSWVFMGLGGAGNAAGNVVRAGLRSQTDAPGGRLGALLVRGVMPALAGAGTSAATGAGSGSLVASTGAAAVAAPAVRYGLQLLMGGGQPFSAWPQGTVSGYAFNTFNAQSSSSVWQLSNPCFFKPCLNGGTCLSSVGAGPCARACVPACACAAPF